MADLVSSDRIVLPLSARTKLQVIEKLSRFAAERLGIDAQTVRQEVLARDDLTTFGVGRGIAIPHGTVPDLTRPAGIFARLKQPVDFGAADGRLADLILFLLAPVEQPDVLLRALSCVTRRLREDDVVTRLRAANKPDEAHVILTTNSWRASDPSRHWAESNSGIALESRFEDVVYKEEARYER
jgi:PTS system nitrogen regulatory IIA component